MNIHMFNKIANELNDDNYIKANEIFQNFLELYPHDDIKYNIIFLYIKKFRQLIQIGGLQKAEGFIKKFIEINFYDEIEFFKKYYEIKKAMWKNTKICIENKTFDLADIPLSFFMLMDTDFETEVYDLVIHKLKQELLNEEYLFEHFLLKIGDNFIILAFIFNLNKNPLNIIVKHILGTGRIYTLYHEIITYKIFKMNNVELIETIFLKDDYCTYEIKLNYFKNKKEIAIIKRRAHIKNLYFKISNKDIELKDSEGKKVQTSFDKNIVKFNSLFR